MSKGKNKKNGKTSFKVALGFDNFTGEKTNFTVGITSFAWRFCKQRPCISEYLRLLGSLHVIFLYSTLFWLSGNYGTDIYDDGIIQDDWCL